MGSSGGPSRSMEGCRPRSCSPLPVGTARGSSEPSRRSSARSDPRPARLRPQAVVHNAHVVRDLEAKGAVFVEEDRGARGRRSHPSAPRGRPGGLRQRRTPGAYGPGRDLPPVVTKVHLEARRFADHGRTICADRPRRSRGGRRHHRPGPDRDDPGPDRSTRRARSRCSTPRTSAYLTQTTLSVDETNAIVEALRERFPSIQGPPREDICYATQNRQDAIKEVARRSDVVLVIGSDNSSNSNRLAEVARDLAPRRTWSTTRPRSTRRGLRAARWSG